MLWRLCASQLLAVGNLQGEDLWWLFSLFKKSLITQGMKNVHKLTGYTHLWKRQINKISNMLKSVTSCHVLWRMEITATDTVSVTHCPVSFLGSEHRVRYMQNSFIDWWSEWLIDLLYFYGIQQKRPTLVVLQETTNAAYAYIPSHLLSGQLTAPS